MGKIGLVVAKYIVHANISIDGTVDRPDVIGAIFGQTEGLLGEGLELRELQRNGKIGRIEVNLETKGGKASGDIIIPSSLDKAETAIIAAALETIQRIGPCNAKVKAINIEDVRITKRSFVMERAKEILKEFTDNVLPDSQEITDEVSYSVRMMELVEYGKDRLAAGPLIDESDEIIIVEGRADVLNLLKNGIKNTIALNGTSIPKTIIELCKVKDVVVFVDGDRGGDLILKELMNTAEVDFVARAPDGKEVEEMTKKEINKALRVRVAVEQAKLELPKNRTNRKYERKTNKIEKKETSVKTRRTRLNQNESELFKNTLDDLVGTRGAYLLDQDNNVLGKVPTTELNSTIKSLRSGINTVVFDGTIDSELVRVSERSKIKNLVAMDSNVLRSYKVKIITKNDL